MIPFNQYVQHTDERICEWINGAIDILPPPSAAELRVRDFCWGRWVGLRRRTGRA
ncbi:MAG: hypothetical protein HC853_17140 [Anaerolineae bacterium]|nr:hypothetical protein [Anaerolineae bacterium]